MARENRFSRRILGRGLREFLEQAKDGTLRARIMSATSEVIYVLVLFSAGQGPKDRIAELGNRCFIARHALGAGDIIIGVGIGRHVRGVGTTSDLIYLNLSDWSPADDEMARKMKADLGYFDRSVISRSQEDEFPRKKEKRRKR
jgi:hypothetical protein